MLVPAALEEIEKRYWRDLWDTAVDDAVMEMRIDLARFGPVQASIVAEEPEEPALNLVLGAGAPGAVEAGHLADAIEWAESHEVDYRVPVTPGRPAADEAERWLMERGNEQGGSRTKLVRDTSPPQLPAPPGIEVIAREDPDEDECFADSFAENLGMPCWASTFFFELPGAEGWHCYVATEGDDALAYVAMLVHAGVAELTLASHPRGVERENGGGAALLRRCIEDAAAAGCEAIFAEVPELDPEPLSESRESLLRAGFEQAFVRPDWRPPGHAVAEARWRDLWL
jgi:hypothetical protein